jgi:hypothetical protein
MTSRKFLIPSPPPCSPTHSLPFLIPGVFPELGHISLQDQGASLPNDGRLVHLLLHMQLETRALGLLFSSYCCSTNRVADHFNSLGTFSSSSIGPLCSTQKLTVNIYFYICQALALPHKRGLWQGPVIKILLAYAIVSGFGGWLWDGSRGGAVSGWSSLQSQLQTLSL